ncbi:MAG: thermonuclease family protein [Actinomycetota bacterium]
MRPITILLTALIALAGCGDGADSAGPPAQPPADPPVTASAGLSPQGRTVAGADVERVVDGDTIRVIVDGREVTVRMIGIDTPESVKPDSPVECFGPEASQFARDRLSGASVTLELDASQGSTDQYGRTLAYVWVEGDDGSLALFNLAAVEAGYAVARQYGRTPFEWKDQFRAAEQRARSAGVGLWGACPRS